MSCARRSPVVPVITRQNGRAEAVSGGVDSGQGDAAGRAGNKTVMPSQFGHAIRRSPFAHGKSSHCSIGIRLELGYPALTCSRFAGVPCVKKGFSANLDLLRTIAVLLVLIQHLCRRLHIEHLSWIPTTSLGYFGVLLFFVHTSLVLMYSLERTHLGGPSLFVNFIYTADLSYLSSEHSCGRNCGRLASGIRHQWHCRPFCRNVPWQIFSRRATASGPEPCIR